MNAKGRTGRLGAPLGAGSVGTGWKAFFWVAALFNLLIGALGMFSPEGTVDTRIVGLLVFAFGFVYLAVARDPMRHAPVLWAGVIGKVGVVALLAPEVLGTGSEPILLGVLALDALFAAGFLIFLLTKAESD